MVIRDGDHEWCLDSRCTAHMSSEKDIFQNLSKIDKSLSLANNATTKISGSGKVKLLVDNGERDKVLNIDRVFYVSDLRTNLMSVFKITDKGYHILFRENDAIVIDKNEDVVFRADKIGNLYYVRKCKDAANAAGTVFCPSSELDEWHNKLGHLNERDLKNMVKNELVHGLKLDTDQKLTTCHVCIREKQTRAPFPKSGVGNDRTQDLLEIVYTDVCGPMRHQSHSGKKYFVTFIDDKSR